MGTPVVPLVSASAMKNRVSRASYDANYFDSLDQQDESVIYRKILYLFEMVQEVVPSGLVLDAGCGAGHGLMFFQNHGARVVGLDRFSEVTAMAAQRVPSAVVCMGDLNAGLPFLDNSFGFVFSYEVIEHLTEPEVFLAEVFRVLRPGGRVLIKTPNAWDLWRLICYITHRTWYADVDKTHVRYYSALSLRKLLQKAGFVNAKVVTGTKLFYQGRIAMMLPVRFPRLPVVGNGVVALGVRPNDTSGKAVLSPERNRRS